MNLVKVANMLKSASDQDLAGELQNPSGSVPSYMVLSELDRRKKLRGSLMMNEPQSSVAEDFSAPPADEMGLGSLGAAGAAAPAQASAPQGFAQGGEVKHFFAGDEVNGPYTSEPGWNPFSWFGEKHGFIDPKQMGFGYMNDPEYKKWIDLGLTPDQAKQKVTGVDSRMGKTPDTEPAVRQAPSVVPPAPPRAPGNRMSAPDAASSKGTSDEYSVNPLLQETRDIRKQMADAYKNQADIYKQQAEDIKKASSDDVYSALMTAGLGIMGGRSQYAAQNISQGGLPAMQQYLGASRERQRELQKLAMGEGALGIDQLGAQMRGVSEEGKLGMTAEELALKRRELADKRAYQQGMLSQAGTQNRLALQELKGSQTQEAMLQKSYLSGVSSGMIDPSTMPYAVWKSKVMPSAGTILPEGVTIKQISK